MLAAHARGVSGSKRYPDKKMLEASSDYEKP
jgi:hypothetical protein